VANPKLVPLHPDVRRYLESEYGLVLARGATYPMTELIELVSAHSRRIAASAMKGIFMGQDFGVRWEGPPFSVEALASFLGHRVIREKPPLSDEAELHPNPDSPGYYLIYCNPALPYSRQNFGIAHELGHTIIPPYDFRARKRATSDDQAYSALETLCNAAASEFLLPFEPFKQELVRQGKLSVESWTQIADLFEASREAVALRAIKLGPGAKPLALVRFSHKLKPVQIKSGQAHRTELRVDYCRPSNGFQHYFPPHKSVPDNSPLEKVFFEEKPYSGDFVFDLKTGPQTFYTEAVYQHLATEKGHVLALIWEP
jgi:uncharacterized protein DUF955